MKKDTQLTLKVTSVFYQRLAAVAKAEDRSLNWTMTKLMDEALTARQRRKQR